MNFELVHVRVTSDVRIILIYSSTTDGAAFFFKQAPPTNRVSQPDFGPDLLFLE